MEVRQSSRFWKRLRRNKLSLVAMMFIGMMLFVALFAYPLSPDDSTNANTMILEIATKKPGFTSLFLKKYKSKSTENNSWLAYMVEGKELPYELIPIQSYRIERDSIEIQKTVDDQLSERRKYQLKDVYPFSSIQMNDVKQKLITKKTFWLGTDRYGRDMLSRLILGSRVSMAVGIIAVLISIFIGVLLGAMSGYFGGWVDQLITWLINVLWAIPTLLLVFAITFALGKGFWQIFIAVGLTMWVGTARLIRGQVMSIKEMEYIQAAKVMGFSNMRIILKHILPNVMGPTIVMAASNFATAILIEAGLSFLGIGVQPPVSSWGLMIKENYNFIITNRPMLAIIPGIAIMLIVLAFNLLGNALRDALDVKGN